MKPISFKMSDDEIIKSVEHLRSQPVNEKCHFFDRFPNCTIGEAAKLHCENFGRNPKERPALVLIEIILSINRDYNKLVKPRITKLENRSFSSFADLSAITKKYSQDDFYQFWMVKDERKYQILLDCLDTIEILKDQYQTPNDYQAMHFWAKDVNILKHANDPIGKIKGIGLATIQHLRMNFGIDTVKPDRQVMSVLDTVFNKKTNNIYTVFTVGKIAEITGYSSRELDQIFVNYGSGHLFAETDKKKTCGIKNNI